MPRTRKSYKVLGFVATVMVALLVLGACGGGEPEATATAAPSGDTATPAAATPTSAPATATPTTADPSDEGTGDETTAAPAPSGGGGTSLSLEGVPQPEPFTGGEEVDGTEQIIEMIAMGGSGQAGTARIVQVARISKIEISLSPPGDGNQVVVIGRGRCEDEERHEQVDYILFDVEDGESISTINTPPVYFSFSRQIILVYNSDSVDSGEAACGNIPSSFS